MKTPECPHCKPLTFPDGEVFHELTCPAHTGKTDNRDKPKGPHKCSYYDEDSPRKCTHPNKNRRCCSPEDQPKPFNENEEGCSIETISKFVDDNPEFDISDFTSETTFTCYQCLKTVKYLFDDSRCKDCTRMTPEEVRGEIHYNPYED